MDLLTQVLDFLETTEIVRYKLLWWIFGMIFLVILWLIGVIPALWRLGISRWRRKIGILANSKEYGEIRKDLVESGIFRDKNIVHITTNRVSDIASHSLVIVDYKSLNPDQIKNVLSSKQSYAGMVFYYSISDSERIPDDMMFTINNTPHTIIVNFRGRLINDVFTTLITTQYAKR